MEKLLTIVIPTYNRSLLLDSNLSQLSKLISMYDFDLIVCDNASTDQTMDVIDKWRALIPHLQVIHHPENVFFDRNVASGYMSFKTKYCWIMGDSYSIDESGLKKVLDVLKNKKPQALIVNAPGAPIKGNDRVFDNACELFKDLGWYVTNVSSCIISKNFVSRERCERYYDSGFIHEGVFFDFLSSLESVDVWLIPSVCLLQNLSDKKAKAATGWMRTPFAVFGKRWFAFIMSLPYKYSIDDKLYCIKQHHLKQNVFSPRVLLKNKLSGYTTFKDYWDSRNVLRYVYGYPLLITDIISIIPSMPRFYTYLKKIANDLGSMLQPADHLRKLW